MNTEPLGFVQRLWLGFVLPWRLLFDGHLAAHTQRLLTDGAPEPAPAPAPEPEAPIEPESAELDGAAAMQLLALFQREGRFVDFLMEDITDVGDADIGAAARVVHRGCRKWLDQNASIAPIRSEAEGDAVTLEPGYDAARNRVTGNVVGEAPYAGQLAHPGWEVATLTLPSRGEGHDPRVLAPAEVELS